MNRQTHFMVIGTEPKEDHGLEMAAIKRACEGARKATKLYLKSLKKKIPSIFNFKELLLNI